jgi:thioredoxin 1
MSILNTKRITLMAITVLVGLAAVASAASWKTFEKSAFQSALKSSTTVLVDFHATWCPTCAKQKAALDKVLAEKEFQAVTPFVADYDTSTDLKKEMGIRSQSTLVVFKAGREVARTVGTTAPDELRELLRKGL